MSDMTFLWHDYETFGTSPQRDLPCQFAAIRTDADLNEIGQPINILSQIANDYLPQPQACLVTGITPQQTLRDGMIEAEFARQIQAAMSVPNTCVAGYNSIRFDDEVTRNLFHRNFIDPYAREWRNGNSRWDIIDLARACYALRPDGIEWPEREDGAPSFKLEHLTAANGLDHGHAHDALSDVRATIGLAKLIKDKQPRLFEYALTLRSKHKVMEQFDFSKPSVLLHVSSKLPASQGCCTWVMPVAKHPSNPNAIIVIDLTKSPEALINATTEEIKSRLYMPASELEDESLRPGLKLIHINRAPFVTTAKAMTEDNAARLGLDRDQCLTHFQQLAKAQGLISKIVDVYETPARDEDDDVDHSLYSGGFLSDEDRRWCERVHAVSPQNLVTLTENTQNIRLQSQLFRYRARNYPSTLTDAEMRKWQAHRQFRLTDPDSPASITLENYLMELESLAQQHTQNPNKQAILRALYQYAESL